jgi:predicted lipid-binding transport protein (Tim44 family)
MGKVKKTSNNKWIAIFGIFAIAMLAVIDAWARPGGGSSYSGGGGGGSSGGGGGGGGSGGDAEAVLYILYYVVMYPHISLPIIGVVLIYYWLDTRNKPKQSIIASGNLRENINTQNQITDSVREFRKRDPRFSRVLFLDFASHLYHRYHHWRSKPEFANLAPYIDETYFKKSLESYKGGVEVTEVVIGSAEIVRIKSEIKHDTIFVKLESNFTETHNNQSYRLWQVDQWVFRRRKGSPSLGPERMLDLGCPNCGSSLEVKPSGECIHCGVVVKSGEQQWQLYNITHVQRESRKGEQFGTYAQEQGTNLVTVFDPHLDAEISEFCKRHHTQNWDEYFANFTTRIVKPYLATIYESYEKRNWELARPLLSDNLFRSHHYWVMAYKENGLINYLKDLQVNWVQLARLESDEFYEAMTIRFGAKVVDYLENEHNKKRIGGSNKPRVFTEYWTFVRRTGVEKKETEVKTDHCQNCGAPVSIGMTGVCNHCKAKVTTGDFGWVLAVITQDEVYAG